MCHDILWRLEVQRVSGHVHRASRNVDMYLQKQRVLDTLCVQLINIPVLMPVLLFIVWATELMFYLQNEGFNRIPPFVPNWLIN